jgi:transposase
MAYKIAAIDIHKSVLMVALASTANEVKDATGAAVEFECRRFGAGQQARGELVKWLQQNDVVEVVMESTAQYWKPIWLDLEPHFEKLHLAQAHSNRAPKGRKNDFGDAKRMARRLLADELVLSFVPDPEQRLWRILARGKQQLVRDRVRLQNQVEALLEEVRIKLSSVISDLFGVSGRRILQALAEGESDPTKLAALGNDRLQCGKEALADALSGSLEPLHRAVLKLHLARLQLLDEQIQALDGHLAQCLKKHEDAVKRVTEMPGFLVDAAQQMVAEVGADAAAFPSSAQFCSWAGVCPGSEESAEQNRSSRSAKGNGFVRRILTQAAQAAVKTKGAHFQNLFHRLLPKLGRNGAIWAVAHRLGRVLWKILHEGVRYIEYGHETTPQAKKRRAQRLAKALRELGYDVTLTPRIPHPAPVPGV